MTKGLTIISDKNRMRILLLGALLISTSCGRSVNIDHSNLESASALSEKNQRETLRDATIVKMQSQRNYIKISNESHSISEKSSLSVKDFISKLPLGNSIVTFKGEKRDDGYVISEIYRK